MESRRACCRQYSCWLIFLKKHILTLGIVASKCRHSAPVKISGVNVRHFVEARHIKVDKRQYPSPAIPKAAI
jgi:hypothetical protein